MERANENCPRGRKDLSSLRAETIPAEQSGTQVRRTEVWLSATLLGSLLGGLFYGTQACALEISVCSHGCDHATIQAAINAASEGDILRVAGGRYAERLAIDKSLTIRGAGARITIIDGKGAGRVISSTGRKVILSGLTITGGDAKGESFVDRCGGGLFNTAGELTLLNSVMSHNRAENGGGICTIFDETKLPVVFAVINLDQTLVVDNEASVSGGGLVAGESTVNLIHSRIHNNHAVAGGGIAAGESTILATDSVIAHNHAQSGGGMSSTFGIVHVTHSAINDNEAAEDGGGIYNSSLNTLVLTNSSVLSNEAEGNGGGIFNNPDETNMVLTNTVVAYNEAGDGGGLFTELAVTIVGTTRFLDNEPQDIVGPIIHASEPVNF